MAEEKEKLLRLVNSSGFPFQLRIAEQIRTCANDPGFAWSLICQEYPWYAKDDDRGGFIDIVIRNKEHDRMVLECKRSRNADWVFLLPTNGHSHVGTRARMLYVSLPSDAQVQMPTGWHNFYTQPESMISEFCIVRGTGEDQRPMLESLAGILLKSIECLAQEELSFALEANVGLNCSYIPVIVTNANIQICRFELSSVSLENGEIPDGDFEAVPFIRFSKTLSNKTRSNSAKTDLSTATREKERTVFVVQSSHLESFLGNWYVPNNRENQKPWN